MQQSAYTYDASLFEHTNRVSLVSARKVVDVVKRIVPVRSVLDVGCAQGVWLRAWHDQGVHDLAGIDGDYVDRERMQIDPTRFIAHDLSTPFKLGRRFDLVESLEVAEHLPGSRAESFVDDLTRHASVVLFSAAPPGQGGENHISERPYSFWRKLFAERGYALIDCVRPLLRDDDEVATWYRYNTFLFLEEHLVQSLPSYIHLYRVPANAPIRDVSSPLYQARKEVVRRLPYWATQFLARAKARVAPGT